MIQYDDRNLQRLFTELTPKQRLRALKGAFRREANRVRRVAVNNLRSSIRSDRDLERGVRALVWKRKAGFRVTVGTKQANKKTGKGERGYHVNRRGQKKPVLLWAESGTRLRRSKRATRYPVGGSWRIGKNRGRMKRYGFMAKTRDQVRDSVTDSLHNEIINNIKRVAKKYGCT